MKKRNRKITTVGFIALGCAKNVIDSEKMLAQIAQSGLVITNEPYDADVIVINTCGFIEPAKAEALQTIRHAVNCKVRPRRNARKVIVAGCLAQRLGRQLFDLVDGIDAVIGLGQRDNIARIIKKTLLSNQPAAHLEHWPKKCSNDTGRLLITGRYWAYIRISEGCSHRCTFCTIPEIRGKFRSKSRQDVLTEAAELAETGVVELNIVAQDTTHYGRDLKMKNGLCRLLKEIEKLSGIAWIRLFYLWPAGITDRLIETVASSEKIVHYLDIPIQHVNNQILRAMGRPDTRENLQRLIENLRYAMPDIVLRTTLIVGFPGETEQQFAELVDFVEWAKFDALGCFQFYPESGTAAAKMPTQLPDHVKKARLERLMLTQQKIAFRKNEKRIGSKLVCLVDSVNNKGIGRGRFYGQAPEIDSICIIKNCSAEPGQFIDTKVVCSKDYDLIVRQI